MSCLSGMLTALGCTEGVLSGEGGEAIGIVARRSENALFRMSWNGLLNFAVALLCSVADCDFKRTDFPAPGVGVVGDDAMDWTSLAALIWQRIKSTSWWSRSCPHKRSYLYSISFKLLVYCVMSQLDINGSTNTGSCHRPPSQNLPSI